MKLGSNTGMMLLGIWLILYGLALLIHLDIPQTVMAGLAVAAGVLLLMNR
jgi:hypothetical protein